MRASLRFFWQFSFLLRRGSRQYILFKTDMAYSPVTTAPTGFSAFNAWQQRETYEFLVLQGLAVVLALIISFRDGQDRKWIWSMAVMNENSFFAASERWDCSTNRTLSKSWLILHRKELLKIALDSKARLKRRKVNSNGWIFIHSSR